MSLASSDFKESYQTIEDLIQRVQELKLDINPKTIIKAYEFSKRAHKGQLRESGEPYIAHPLSVAGILVNLRMDQESVITALLHDVVEDTSVSLGEIKKEFGETVLFLVDGVTKISRLSFKDIYQKQNENTRKMLVAMGRDVRVILVKLADRLHNMRTLGSLSSDRQKRIAQETLRIYTPLASRLGMHEMKNELEDLAFQYVYPDPYKLIQEKMIETKRDRKVYLEEAMRGLKDFLDQDFKRKYQLESRYKNLYSIYQKMINNNLSFDQVHDVFGVRVLVNTVRECYDILGAIHSLWKPISGKFKDYIAVPKPNSYQSLHTTVISPSGQQIEVQIRTFDMHVLAERGIGAHWIYKMEKDEKAEATLEKFNWLKDLVSALYNDNPEAGEFMENIKLELFDSEIYVFTPKGDIKELPRGATPIDFAYAIHTDVGNHIVSAEVNNRQVPLKYKLQNGDTVYVNTSPHQHPRKDWVNMSVTSKARTRIKSFIKQAQKEKSIEIGKKIFDQGCRKYHVSDKEIIGHKDLPSFLRKHGLNKVEDLYMNLGFGKILFKNIFSTLMRESLEETQPKFTQKDQSRVKDPTTPVIVDGIDDILVSFGKCCRPVLGDPIRSYISHKKGIIVHRANCPSLAPILQERFVDVTWSIDHHKLGATYVVGVDILCIDDHGILKNMTEVFSNLDLNILQVSTEDLLDSKARVTFRFEVQSINEIEKVIDDLHKVDNVINVKRSL